MDKLMEIARTRRDKDKLTNATDFMFYKIEKADGFIDKEEALIIDIN